MKSNVFVSDFNVCQHWLKIKCFSMIACAVVFGLLVWLANLPCLQFHFHAPGGKFQTKSINIVKLNVFHYATWWHFGMCLACWNLLVRLRHSECNLTVISSSKCYCKQYCRMPCLGWSRSSGDDTLLWNNAPLLGDYDDHSSCGKQLAGV